MIYSNNTYDITNDISTYTRTDFKQVYDTSALKWYMLNNLNQYEEYGIYGNSFDTYYTGKLVIVNFHEYEWDGTEWDDLGEYIEISAVVRDAQHNGYITFPYTTTEVSSIEATLRQDANNDNFFIATGAYDLNDWRVFFHQSAMYYDCGNDRLYYNGYLAKKIHMRFDGNPMRLYDYDASTYLYTGSAIRPPGRNFYWGYYKLDYEGAGIAATPGWLYDVVLYSDNGETAIAHYIPYIQNNVVGLYDTINESFLAPTGVLAAEAGSARPKDYPEKTTPTIVSKWPSVMYTGGHYVSKLYRNGAEQFIWDYMSDDILKKGEVPPFKYEFVDFSLNGLNNTTPFYGFMVKSDYVSYSSYFDICFGVNPGISGTEYVPRVCLDYNGGAYTDTTFLDKSIKSLSTILYNGDTYYYAEFVQTSYYNKNRTVRGSSGKTSNVAEAERTLKLITKINN